MSKTILSLLLTTLFVVDFAEARSCQDEPARCPILRWSCAQRTWPDAQNFVYLSATTTYSLFTGDSLIVKEHFCSGKPLYCREQTSEGRWTLYPATPQGYLQNQQSGQKVVVNCSEHNR
ncbi:hypothetical protein D3C87_144460 [compost metagenome]